MKRALCIALCALMLGSLAAANAEDAVDQIIGARTANAFSDAAVDSEALDKIVTAGLAATSARNLQPWHFAVITNQEVMQALSGGGGGIPGMSPAKAGLGSTPVAIIVYTDTASMQAAFFGGNTALFDCGLAAQNMMVAANLLGYGAKLISGPTDTLNGDQHDAFCEMLGVDTGLSAVAVLLLGVPQAGEADTATSASVRGDAAEKVTYVD